jgi:hypothetical protein
VTHWLTGERLPAENRLPGIAEYFNVSVAEVQEALQKARHLQEAHAARLLQPRFEEEVTLDVQCAAEYGIDHPPVHQRLMRRILDERGQRLPPLLVLYGAAGSGKKLLARALAERVGQKSVRTVDLEAVPEHCTEDQLADVLYRTLPLQVRQIQRDTPLPLVASYLNDRQDVLILRCPTKIHALPGVLSQLGELCPRLNIIVLTRDKQTLAVADAKSVPSEVTLEEALAVLQFYVPFLTREDVGMQKLLELCPRSLGTLPLLAGLLLNDSPESVVQVLYQEIPEAHPSGRRFTEDEIRQFSLGFTRCRPSADT